MTNWTMWASLVAQLIQAISESVGKPVEEVRQRLLADPRVNGAASDAAAALIEQSMPQGDQGPSQQGDQGPSQP